jgi:hypothetical protein
VGVYTSGEGERSLRIGVTYGGKGMRVGERT